MSEFSHTHTHTKRKLLAEMCSKHRTYSKSSNKFNKETIILIISCIIGSVYPINATITFLHVLYMCTILTPLTYTYTIYSHTTGHWCGFFYVPQEPDTNENAVRRNLRFFVLNLSVRTRKSNRLQMP